MFRQLTGSRKTLTIATKPAWKGSNIWNCNHKQEKMSLREDGHLQTAGIANKEQWSATGWSFITCSAPTPT